MRIYVVSDNEAVTAKLRDVLFAEGQECQFSNLISPDILVHRISDAHPDLLVVVLSPNPTSGLALLSQTRKFLSGRLVAVGPASEPRLILQAQREGADRYLDETDVEDEFQAILLRRKSEPQSPSHQQGHLISLLAPSGGSGSSTLAANLATVLAKEFKSCLLLDLNLGAADLAALLDLKPVHTLSDLCRSSNQLDRSMLERSLSRHESGVCLLSPSRAFSDISQVTTQGVGDVLTLGRTLYSHVVVDLDDSFHPEQTFILKKSDIILLVLRLDFTSVRNTRRTLDHLDTMGVPRTRIRVVVNRYGQAKELPASKAEEALNVKIAHYVPEDPKTINRSNNNGIPAVLEAPSSKVSRSVVQLAMSVNGKPKTR